MCTEHMPTCKQYYKFITSTLHVYFNMCTTIYNITNTLQIHYMCTTIIHYMCTTHVTCVRSSCNVRLSKSHIHIMLYIFIWWYTYYTCDKCAQLMQRIICMCDLAHSSYVAICMCDLALRYSSSQTTLEY